MCMFLNGCYNFYMRIMHLQLGFVSNQILTECRYQSYWFHFGYWWGSPLLAHSSWLSLQPKTSTERKWLKGTACGLQVCTSLCDFGIIICCPYIFLHSLYTIYAIWHKRIFNINHICWSCWGHAMNRLQTDYFYIFSFNVNHFYI